MWRKFRIIILLLILATALQELWLDKADLAWKHNLYVAVYPINADGSEEVSAYLRTLSRDDFEPMAEYFAEEAESYKLGLRRPIEVQLGAVVNELPPEPPSNGSVLSTMLWSLKFRWFAWQHSPKVNVKPDIRLYLLYHDPKTSSRLGHSTALNKGRIGRVNLFGSSAYAKKNLVVTAHELLHTLSATDKYDLQNDLPSYPEGYAEPDKMPLYPQNFAELMGGRVPISANQADIPKSLRHTLIGEKTAREIGWLK
ncbi:hypothetical protein [Methylotenera mobilis]|uniref:Uncharacterized protein n=1 Tax=Methylotenera mobilis (strain JLW8 / ATCC BAA-1282 / DSM 17540) TaxID=583345 RepID=C6WTG9_METML|nr:hypothetical protein [Methylotenera mobilis]ACT47291.1 conserved hypothetical protein [Methylotenera mobilis JLW8]